MGPGSHCKPSVFRSIPNALALRSSLAGRACPVHTGRGVSQRGGQAQAPHVPLFAFSPTRLFSRATRQTAFSVFPNGGFGSDRRAYSDVLPDAPWISACWFCYARWHSYTLPLYKLSEARHKTRALRSNNLAAKRLVMAYLSRTEVQSFPEGVG